MTRRRCCCPCWTSEDDFDRAELGDNWTPDDDDDVDIYLNTLRITSGKAIYEVEPVDPYGGILVRVDLVDMQDGDIFRVLVDYEDPEHGSESYYYAQITVSTVGNVPCVLELYRHEDNRDTLLATSEPQYGELCEDLFYEQPNVTAGDTRQFNVYWAPVPDPDTQQAGGLLKAWLGYTDDGTWPVWTCGTVGGTYGYGDRAGGKVGLAHGGGPRAVRFDELSLIDHCEHNRECPCVYCTCDGICLSTLYLTITYGAATCPLQFPSGTTIGLSRVGNRFVWVSEPYVCEQEPGPGPPTQYMMFLFECVEQGVGTCTCVRPTPEGSGAYVLRIMFMDPWDYDTYPCGGVPFYHPSEPALQSVDCNPLSLVFTWTSTDNAFLACCEDPEEPWPEPFEWIFTVTM